MDDTRITNGKLTTGARLRMRLIQALLPHQTYLLQVTDQGVLRARIPNEDAAKCASDLLAAHMAISGPRQEET